MNISAKLLLGIALNALPIADTAFATDVGPEGRTWRGRSYRILCPTNSFMTGFEGKAGGWIDQLDIVCANWKDPPGTFTASVPRNIRIGDSPGGDPKKAVCPEGWVMGGPQNIHFAQEPIAIHSIEITCRPIGNDTGEFTTLSFGSSSTITYGFAHWDDATLVCPDGEIPKGIFGRAGFYIDALGFVCETVPKHQPIAVIPKHVQLEVYAPEIRIVTGKIQIQAKSEWEGGGSGHTYPP
jgi:hypothetical protein